jgi:modulator of FtsH protease
MSHVSLSAESSITEESSKVLRNTFLMLFLCVAITAVSGFVALNLGMATFLSEFPYAILGIFLLQLAVAFGFRSISKTKVGFPVLIAFAAVEGMLLVPLLSLTLSDPMVAVVAFGITAVILLIASIVGSRKGADYSSIGRYLFFALIGAIIAMVANLFIGSAPLDTALSCFIVALFSVYIVYDVNKVVLGGEDSYLNAAFGLYLNVVNIFIHLCNLGD